MAFYVYCPKKSQTALDLCKRLDAQRLRAFDGLYFWSKQGRIELQEGDVVIPWGCTLLNLDGINILNGVERAEFLNPWFEDSPDLPSFGVRTPQRFATERECRAYISSYWGDDKVQAIGRKLKHRSGNDMLLSTEPPFDYWTFKYTVNQEWRFHVFNGKIVRTAERAVKDGFRLVADEREWRPNDNLAHPWIRTGIGGYQFKYEDFNSTPAARNAAINIIKLMGLTFGVVDIAFGPSSQYTVFGLTTAPRLDEKGLEIYVKAINRWKEKDEKDDSSRDGRGGEAEQPVPPPAVNVAPAVAFDANDYINRHIIREAPPRAARHPAWEPAPRRRGPR